MLKDAREEGVSFVDLWHHLLINMAIRILNRIMLFGWQMVDLIPSIML